MSTDYGQGLIVRELKDLDVSPKSRAWQLVYDNAMEASQIMSARELKTYIQEYLDTLPNQLFEE